MLQFRPIIALILLVALFGLANSGFAHPFDIPKPEVSVRVDKATRSIRIEYLFRCDTAVTSLQEQQNSENGLDRDSDGKIEPEEVEARKREFLREISKVSNLRVDGKPVLLAGSIKSSSVFDLRTGAELYATKSVGPWLVGYLFVLNTEASASGLLGEGKRRITFSAQDARLNTAFASIRYRAVIVDSKSGKERPVFDPDMETQSMGDGVVEAVAFDVTIPKQVPKETPKEEPAPLEKTLPPADTESEADTRSKKAIEEAQRAFESGEGSENARQESELRVLLEEVEGGGMAMLLAFLAIFGLGAWHALQPGHGKTLVASYLISTHGRPKDALTLGITVTFAHVSGVFLMLGIWLGIEWLYPEFGASRQTLAASIIAVAVGATIFLMGVALLLKRVGDDPAHHHDIFGRHVGAGQGHSHSHDHDHDHDHAHDHEHSHRHRHSHDHEHGQGEHSHSHDHEHEHEHGHTHAHDHAHHDPKAMTTWQIVRLGILGGLLPCPTAFALALLTVLQGKALLGVWLIVVFSLGLAMVLSLIGFGLVVTKSYLRERQEKPGPIFRLFERYIPVLGALAITLIGFVITLAALKSGWGVDLLGQFV